MKIQNVQNITYMPHNRQNVNFKGDVKRNDVLDEFIEEALLPDYLAKFKKTLQDIKTVDDGAVYWVEEHPWHPGSFFTDFMLYKKIGQGKPEIVNKCMFNSHSAIPRRLLSFAEVLDRLYDGMVPKETEETLKQDIRNLLVDC